MRRESPLVMWLRAEAVDEVAVIVGMVMIVMRSVWLLMIARRLLVLGGVMIFDLRSSIFDLRFSGVRKKEKKYLQDFWREK